MILTRQIIIIIKTQEDKWLRWQITRREKILKERLVIVNGRVTMTVIAISVNLSL